MAFIKRTYPGITDLDDRVLPGQSDSPENLAHYASHATNIHQVVGGDNLLYTVADPGSVPHGAKTILWSSEGFTYRGVKYSALTANQKKATGTSALNLATGVSAASQGALPAGFTLPTQLDVSPYHNLVMMIAVTSFTGGTSPSIQFEFDSLDDVSPTPNSVALIKPAALTAAGNLYLALGYNAGTAPSLSGWTASAVNFPFSPNGQIAWTVGGAPTAIAWTAFLYGMN